MAKSRILMAIGVLLLLPLFVLPLWNITLEAPQYPIPLGMDIYINKLVGANPNDIKNINIMNHYVGMKAIPDSLKEFAVFPPVIIGVVVLGLLIAFKFNYKWFMVWFILVCLLGVAGLYDFYLWEYDYGHDLNPNAIMKFTDPQGNPMGYQPPLLGTKKILNFTAHSYPLSGAYLMFFGMFLTFIAYFVGKKEAA